MKFINALLIMAAVSLATAATAQKLLPDVSVKSLEGQSVEARSLAVPGKTTIISFWATWCSPCKKELDAVSEVYEEWQKKYNIELVAVSIDDARSVPKVKPMVEQKLWDFRVVIDSNKDLMNALNIQNVPYTVLLDAKGNIVWTHSGYIPGDEAELEKEIAKLTTN